MKKKFISCILAVFLILPCFCILVACSNVNNNLEFRVQENYIQWSKDGDEWENLVSIDDLQGEQGVNGKQVEFQTTETHIQWRYVGESSWTNLISLDELNGRGEESDIDTLKVSAFNLFSSKISSMNNNYKVTYDYADKYFVESFGRYGYYVSDFDSVGGCSNIVTMNASMHVSGYVKNLEEEMCGYSLNLMPYINGPWKPTTRVVRQYEYRQDLNEYRYKFKGGKISYPAIGDDITDYEFVSILKNFTLEDVVDCKFNDNGDCKIEFQYSKEINGKNLLNNYFTEGYFYEFDVTKDGEIKRCYVYENSFLDSNQKGDLFCKITYEKGESLITSYLLDDLLETMQEEDAEIKGWFDVFGYELQQ